MFLNEVKDLIERSDLITVSYDGSVIDSFTRLSAVAWTKKGEAYGSWEFVELMLFLMEDDDLQIDFWQESIASYGFELLHTVKPYTSKACI